MNNDAIDKAVKQASKLAAKLKDWRSELATVEAQAVTLADQRIAALTIDETERADKLADAVARANGRAADLQQMIVKRETEVKAALMQAWDSVIVTSAAARYAEAERDYKEKNDRYLSLAPQAANAQTAAYAGREELRFAACARRTQGLRRQGARPDREPPRRALRRTRGRSKRAPPPRCRERGRRGTSPR